jgi:hypothetical protein
MANFDNPNGFTPVGSEKFAQRRAYTASATITEGDLLAMASGQVLPYVEGTHTEAVGVAAHDGVSGDSVLVYDDPAQVFQCQTATGTNYVAATHDGDYFQVTGATGAQELELASAANGTMMLLKQYPISGSTETGANARVLVKIAKHLLGNDSLLGGVTASAVRIPALTVGSESANVIAVTVQIEDADQNAISEAVDLYCELLLSTGEEPNPASQFNMAATTGTEVTTTAQENMIVTTNASGVAVLDITDVAGASGSTIQLLVRSMGGVSAARRAAITFD